MNYIKPVLDFLVALIVLLVTLPISIVIALLLSVSFMGNPLFIQQRVGKNNRLFYLIKFRTMSGVPVVNGVVIPDEQRLTGLGRFIRKTSLDEIPQLINILKGEMSFVGPRPLLVEYLPLYSEEQARRHTVRPGITGWAQVHGRNTISWKQKFEYDVWYVGHISILLDLKILMKTIVKVLKAEGISGRGVATAEKFNGSN